MAKKQLKDTIELTVRQYRLLTKLLATGEWVYNAKNEEYGQEIDNEVKKLEQYIFSQAERFRSKDLITRSEEDQEYIPTEEMEEEVAQKLDDHLYHEIRDRLAEGLAMRDLREMTDAEMMEYNEFRYYFLLFQNKYLRAFNDRGLHALMIREDEARVIGDAPPIYDLEVQLRDVEPPVRRRIEVSGAISLEGFHHLIQKLMGWKNAHLYRFEKDGQGYTVFYEEEMMENVDNDKDVTGFKVKDLLQEEGDAMSYEYDFGDGWIHDIRLIRKADQPLGDWELPYCIEGEGACPPEDCGGPGGYAELKKILKDPGHPEHQEMIQWTDGGHDPDAFDVERTNRIIRV